MAPRADRVYRIMKKDIDGRGRIRWQSALPAEIATGLRTDYLTVWPFLLSVSITLLIAVGTVVHFVRRAAQTNPVDVLRRE